MRGDTVGTSRYDGQSDWYDDFARASRDDSVPALRPLLGTGTGICLDLGCGTGLYLDLIATPGYTVMGLDVSTDQLAKASRLGHPLIQANASVLPIADASVALITAIWLSTDVDDFSVVLAECARVLAPSGRLVVFGAHPCFNGPHVENLDDGSRVAHTTYRQAGWHRDAPWWGDGVRRRVGMRHLPLAEYLNSFVVSGLRIVEVHEPRDEPVPFVLAVIAAKDQ